jgi:hypothetical protein
MEIEADQLLAQTAFVVVQYVAGEMPSPHCIPCTFLQLVTFRSVSHIYTGMKW